MAGFCSERTWGTYIVEQEVPELFGFDADPILITIDRYFRRAFLLCLSHLLHHLLDSCPLWA